MPGGQNNTQTTTTTIVPTEQQEYLAQLGIDKIEGFTPPDKQVAPFNPVQLLSQLGALQSVPGQNQLGTAGADATNFLLTQALFPSTNPALQDTIDAANTAANRNLTSNILPAIRSEAALTGNFGGSRQGIAEGIVARDAARDASDRAAAISTAGYQSGLQAMLASLGLLPQTQQALTQGASTTAAVGDTRQGQTQSELDASFYNMMFPWLQGQDLIGLSSGLPGGSTTSTIPAPQKSFLGSLLGGAATGASIAPGHPLIGALIGGALGGGSYFF